MSEPSQPDSGRKAVRGGARLCYRGDADVGTRLTEQWVRPPLHMAKVYQDRGWAISQMMSPTAGLLDGDLLEVNCAVKEGGRAALISPAACRVHTMDGGFATIQQKYVVEEGSALDIWPAPLILQRGASLRQETELHVGVGATVLMCEVITPGRASFGEQFEFTEWRSKLRIYLAGDLVSYENFAVSPKRGDVSDWRALYPDGSYASLYLITPEPLGDLVQSLHDLELDSATVGASPLRTGGLGVKILAADGIALRKAIFSVRNLLILHSKLEFPIALKRAQTFFH
jgi:Urease accessory protein UreH